MTIAPSASGLDALLGLRSLEGVREVDQGGARVLLIRLDGEVSAVFVGDDDRIGVVRMRDRRWPLLPDHLSRLHGEELEAADPGPPVVCNFIRRPDPPEQEWMREIGRRGQPGAIRRDPLGQDSLGQYRADHAQAPSALSARPSGRLPVVGRDQAQALLGAWQQIVGFQNSGQPTNLYHGTYGGHRARGGLARSDVVCAVDEARNLIVLEVGVEAPTGSARVAADRAFVQLGSGTNVLPNGRLRIASRPHSGSLRIERLIIGGNPALWIVNDVRIGNRSQFTQSGDVPGEMFAATTIDSFVRFETVRRGTDFTIDVTYVGPDPAGAPFVGALMGTIDLSPVLVARWTPEGRFEPWMAGVADAAER